MKKIFTVAIMALVSAAASAQVYVGGGLGAAFQSFSYKNGGSTNATVLTIGPEVGYYFNDKLAVGAQFEFGMTKAKDYDAVCTTAENAYVRYDFLETGAFRLGAEVAVGYQTLGKNQNDKQGGRFGVSLRPVAQFAINDKLSVVARFDLVSYSKDNETAGSSSRIGFGIASGTSAAKIGVAYKF